MKGRSVSKVEKMSRCRERGGCRITHRQMTLMLFEDMIKGKVRSEGKECVGERADVRHECTRCRAKASARSRPQLAITNRIIMRERTIWTASLIYNSR